MIIRKPDMADCYAIVEMYSDWPLTNKTGPITLDLVGKWIRRWRARSDEVCWVGVTDETDIIDGSATEAGVPVGLILYMMDLDTKVSTVYNMVVHPDHRGKGFMDKISRACWAHDVQHFGIEKAEFAVMESAAPIAHRITDQASSGQTIRYKKIGEKRYQRKQPEDAIRQPLLEEGESGRLIVAEEPVPLDEIDIQEEES